MTPEERSYIISVLNWVDGHLGLAVYRGVHDDEWKSDAARYIIELRNAIKVLEKE